MSSKPQALPDGVPADAKRKTLREQPWTKDRIVTVYLSRCDRLLYQHVVHSDAGEVIGYVGSYEGSIDRRIPGTRLRHEGVRRTLWTASTDPDHLGRIKYTSMADAIRALRD